MFMIYRVPIQSLFFHASVLIFVNKTSWTHCTIHKSESFKKSKRETYFYKNVCTHQDISIDLKNEQVYCIKVLKNLFLHDEKEILCSICFSSCVRKDNFLVKFSVWHQCPQSPTIKVFVARVKQVRNSITVVSVTNHQVDISSVKIWGYSWSSCSLCILSDLDWDSRAHDMSPMWGGG